MSFEGNLRHLKVIVAIDEEGTLAAAGRRLGLSLPSVSRILSQVEADLGGVLFERSARRCQATAAGREVVERSRQLLADYSEMMEAVSGNWIEPKGTVRMTAPMTFGRLHVLPAVCRFLETNPGIDIGLHLSDAVIDLNAEEFDLGLRIGVVTTPSLVVRRVGTVCWWMLASPEYLEKHGCPQSVKDLAGHLWIQHSSILQPTRSPRQMFGAHAATMSTRLAVNDAPAALEAARRGAGIVSALSYQAAADVAERRLVRILADTGPSPLPVSLVYPETRRTIERVRRLVDFLALELSELLTKEQRTD
ncbi:LysR family transcriptional regulator [Roseibium sp. M-1]